MDAFVFQPDLFELLRGLFPLAFRGGDIGLDLCQLPVQAGEIQSARIGQLFKQPGLPFLQLFQTAFQLGDPFLGFFPVGGQRFTRLRPRTAAVAGEVR